jgi:Spy/CpxP family protein refolding chaperone
MNRTMVLFFVVVVMVVFSVSVTARPFMGKQIARHGMMEPGPSPLGIYTLLKAKQKDFNIKDNQLEQIKNSAFALEEKIVTLESKNRLYHLELQKLLMTEKKDYKKISDVLSQLSANRNAIFVERMKSKDTIDSILTPEQQDSIKEAMQKRFKDRRPPERDRRGMLRGDFPGDEMPGPGIRPKFGVEENLD